MNNKPNSGSFKKGLIPWNKGSKNGEFYSYESRQKMGLANLGRKLSEEHRKKIGLNGFHYGMLGKKHSLETRKKMSESHKGEKSYSWEGGKTKSSAKIRNSFEYRLWRSDCFRRDDFTCQECHIRGGKLSIDHIKPFSLIIAEYKIFSLKEALACEELWDINNGRTLCWGCHQKTNTFAGRAKLCYN